jgi:hypothetical protein
MIRRSRRRVLRKNLRNSVSDGAAFCIMVGIGETYFPAFVLALGMGEIASGLVASIPLLVGAILQMISPVAVARLGSNRRWVVTSASLQAASFLPLIIAAVMGHMPIAGVFAAVSDQPGTRGWKRWFPSASARRSSPCGPGWDKPARCSASWPVEQRSSTAGKRDTCSKRSP